MSTVLTVPASLDDASFETLLQARAALPPDEKVLVDARHTRWADSYGLVGLLTLGQSFAERPQFAVPDDANTESYWARAGFFTHAATVYDLNRATMKPRAATDTPHLLQITPIARTEDVQHVVAHIQEGSKVIMGALGFPASSAMGFSVVMSESCQNIVEHAGAPGWVAVQRYNWERRLGRSVVMIAVSDAGVGFRESLYPTRGVHMSRWSDRDALEAAVLGAVSRFHDPGRGQGLMGIRRFVKKWEARLTVRSGTSRIAILPAWDTESRSMVEQLPAFPGAQLQIVIPELTAP